MKKSRRPLPRLIDTRSLSAVTGGGLYEWLGLGCVPIVPGVNGDGSKMGTAGGPAEREGASTDTRH